MLSVNVSIFKLKLLKLLNFKNIMNAKKNNIQKIDKQIKKPQFLGSFNLYKILKTLNKSSQTYKKETKSKMTKTKWLVK
jgi:hypothetical protein